MTARRRHPRTHSWSVLCLKPIIEAGTNKVSLIDIPERAKLRDTEMIEAFERGEKVAAVVPGLSMVSAFWSITSPGEESYRLDLLCPDTKRLRMAELQIPSSESTGGQRVNVELEAVPFRGLGTYFFEVRWRPEGARWKKIAEVPLEFVLEPDDGVESH